MSHKAILYCLSFADICCQLGRNQENVCNGRWCWTGNLLMQFYPVALLVAMPVSVFWKKRAWPRYTRDVFAALQLSVYAHLFTWIGCATIQVAYESFPGFGVVAVTLAYEVFVTFVYLWARALARRSFPEDCSSEARAVVWVIFCSDMFAEMVRRMQRVIRPDDWLLPASYASTTACLRRRSSTFSSIPGNFGPSRYLI